MDSQFMTLIYSNNSVNTNEIDSALGEFKTAVSNRVDSDAPLVEILRFLNDLGITLKHLFELYKRQKKAHI